MVLLPDTHLGCTAILLGGNRGSKQTHRDVPQCVVRKWKLWNSMLPVSTVWGQDLRGLEFLKNLLLFHSCEMLPSFCRDYLNIYPFLLLDLSCLVLVPVASLLCVS